MSCAGQKVWNCSLPAEFHLCSQEPPQFWERATDITGIFLWKSRHPVKSCPTPSQGPGDVCLSSGFGIWSFKLTYLPMQLCQAAAPDFPGIPVSEVWLQGWHWFHSLSSHQHWQNMSVTFLLPGSVSSGGTDCKASPLTQTRAFGFQLWQNKIWSARKRKQEKRLRLEDISIICAVKALGSLCPGRQRPQVLSLIPSIIHGRDFLVLYML